jgi:biotin carboxyl carrier protein
MMVYQVTIDGRSRQVEIHPHEGHYSVTVDGVTLQTDLREVHPGCYSLLLDGRQYMADVLKSRGWTDVYLGAELHRAELHDARRPMIPRAAAAAGPFELRAPMPGKVVRVLAAEGQTIGPDDGLVVIEAMKMENELRAPQAGVVERVLAQPGQLVESGAVLLRLAPPEPPPAG